MDQRTSGPGVRVSGVVDGERARLHVQGDLDLSTAQAVRDAVCEALDAGAREIVLDLGDVAFLDSTGLSVLLHAARDVDRRGARLRTLSPDGSEARVVMDLARVSGILRLESG